MVANLLVTWLDRTPAVLQEVIQQVCKVQPDQLPALQAELRDYLDAVIGPQGQGRLLVSQGQGSWEWGADLAAAARLLQGLTLAADVVLPAGQALIPHQYKQELPQRLGDPKLCCRPTEVQAKR